MRRIISMLFGVVIGGLLVWGGMRYHLVRSDEGFRLIPKRSSTLAETYIDVRNWGALEWSQHPDLVWAMTQNGQANILRDSRAAENTLKNELKNLMK